MKKLLIVAAAGLLLTGCSEYSRGDRALGGAAIGAGGGALIGGLATRSAGGAIVGGVLGGAAGAIVGAETTPRACTRRYYDYYGNVRYRRVQCP
ncbi:bacteriocin [Labrys sp. KNU-23]|uniref:bacteriocin n=1 Tax=Labrys sp. KNU-23 TaxID=2789216 RepID=UPI0011EE0E01|nr:bacteriocin [Labrys sp. KNU-23]QEN90810.1 bacteriocin [Labrys sp. KNU-23]